MNIYDYNEKYSNKLMEEDIKYMPDELKGMAMEALEAEKKQDYAKARQICEKILAINSDSSVDPVKVVLLRVYPQIIISDIESENGRYNEDCDAYIAFLDSLSMNRLMQEYLVETMKKFCELLDNEWYRPLFTKFIETVDSKGYLTEEDYKDTTLSAHISVESASFYDDLTVGRMIKDFIRTSYMRKFSVPDEKIETIKNSMMIDALTNDWYMCLYIPENENEIEYLKDNYPYSYGLVEPVVKAINDNADAKKDELINELIKYTQAGITAKELEEALKGSYDRRIKESEKDMMIHSDKIPFVRNKNKVGRNDPCPCGSGKKFKQCCGK